MKIQVLNNQIVKTLSRLPKIYYLPDGRLILNMDKLSENELKELDIFDVIVPTYDRHIEKLSDIYFFTGTTSGETFYGTQDVIPLSKEELNLRSNPSIPRREADEGEGLPVSESLFVSDDEYQIRYNFKIGTISGSTTGATSGTTGGTGTYFYYNYMNFDYSGRSYIINNIIRRKYSEGKSESILRKRLLGIYALEFLQFDNVAEYAKNIADGSDLSDVKNKKVYKVVIPLDLCGVGEVYNDFVFRYRLQHVPFVANQPNNTGTLYMTTILQSDLTTIQADPRVTIQQIDVEIPIGYQE